MKYILSHKYSNINLITFAIRSFDFDINLGAIAIRSFDFDINLGTIAIRSFDFDIHLGTIFRKCNFSVNSDNFTIIKGEFVLNCKTVIIRKWELAIN